MSKSADNKISLVWADMYMKEIRDIHEGREYVVRKRDPKVKVSI